MGRRAVHRAQPGARVDLPEALSEESHSTRRSRLRRPFMEPRRRYIEIVKFWETDDQRRRVRLSAL
jgi:hypothetical protein